MLLGYLYDSSILLYTNVSSAFCQLNKTDGCIERHCWITHRFYVRNIDMCVIMFFFFRVLWALLYDKTRIH